MKKKRWIFAAAAMLLSAAVCLGACGGSKANAEDPAAEAETGTSLSADEEQVAIGVSVYNTEDAEVQAFRKYFEDYLGPAFDVKFYYSNSILQDEEEIAFIDQLHDAGVKGLISFLSTDLDAVLSRCDEYGMYYMRGSGSVSDEAFKKAAAHESFLGIIGPNEELERSAGRDMASFFASQRAESITEYLLIAGGGSLGNEMHAIRTEGMLEVLRDTAGVQIGGSIPELARSAEITELASEDGTKTVTILPGYLRDATLDNLQTALDGHAYDVVMGALALGPVTDQLKEAEAAYGKDILIGTVDAFTEPNLDLFLEKDAGGNPVLNYVTGKYGAAVGPAFAAMYNACTGEADFLRVDGEPFQLTMPFWTASDEDTYVELYDRSIDIYDNIYSTQDLRSVIREYSPDASFEEFRMLTEKDWLQE